MNSLLVAGIGIFLFLIAYVFYGRYLEKLWEVNPDEKTPAYKKEDGVDYVPVKHWSILFGHHFGSIAGAGPILGPVIAAVCWGWCPTFLWIVFGSILLGGVHDFSSLMVSIRNEGKSIGDISSSVISKRGKIFFSIFLWFTLILVVAVFAAVTATTFIEEPKIVIPTFSLLIIAIFFGVAVYKFNLPQIYATLISLILYVLLFFLGSRYPVVISPAYATKVWIVILLLYSLIASVLPVNLLLQPRDYLSSFLLFFGLLFGYLGLLITHPQIHTPNFVSYSSSNGPLWPMMFVIIACGAISGFHSLVSSGTTSKQINNEKYAKNIGYGAMLVEGVLSILALICVTAGLYWNEPNSLLNYPSLMKGGNWIGTFALGYGQVTSPIFGSKFGTMLAIVIINSFVLTTLDTATRITRYISEELFGDTFKINIFKNRYFATIFIIIIAGYLAFGSWQKIWPVFGASNQLVAAVVLLICALYLSERGKNSKVLFYPSIFMFLTTIVALVIQAKDFYLNQKLLLGNIASIIVLLALFFIVESIRKKRNH